MINVNYKRWHATALGYRFRDMTGWYVIRKAGAWSSNKVSDHIRGCELIKDRV
jgi:hypothetical protein